MQKNLLAIKIWIVEIRRLGLQNRLFCYALLLCMSTNQEFLRAISKKQNFFYEPICFHRMRKKMEDGHNIPNGGLCTHIFTIWQYSSIKYQNFGPELCRERT